MGKHFEVTSTVSIRKMPCELWARIRYQAFKEGIKMNDMITKLFIHYLESKDDTDIGIEEQKMIDTSIKIIKKNRIRKKLKAIN